MTDEAIDSAFEPYVLDRFHIDDPRAEAARRRIQEKLGRPRKQQRWLTTSGERTSTLVQAAYHQAWSEVALEEELHRTSATWFEWRDRVYRARVIGRKRVYQLFLARAIEWLRPSSVTEIGFGWGLNLLALSTQFPHVRFGGVELTEGGVCSARRLAQDPRTPDLLRDFVVNPVRDVTAPTRLELQQGSAEALPLADRSADLVITVLALEQMERIRPAALREIARVARHHVVMIEPFREWNAEDLWRGYIQRHDYWSGAIDDLPAFHLIPKAASVDMPQKLTFRAGIVVADVKASRVF